MIDRSDLGRTRASGQQLVWQCRVEDVIVEDVVGGEVSVSRD